MRSMKRLLIVLAMFTISAGVCSAQEQKIAFPKGFNGFLADMAKVMKKYPKAAQQFSLRDSSTAKPEPQSSHHACCEWSCDWSPPGSSSTHCQCQMQCPE